uniref:Uncharacterized protein n=1 Tax=Lepeophtheirus salmonis TaxID=72036 RepID=A0A0K2VHK3_LEPSM
MEDESSPCSSLDLSFDYSVVLWSSIVLILCRSRGILKYLEEFMYS